MEKVLRMPDLTIDKISELSLLYDSSKVQANEIAAATNLIMI